MDQDFFITVIWIIFFIWIYKKIKNRKKQRHDYTEAESLDIRRRVSEAQAAVQLTHSEPLSKKFHKYTQEDNSETKKLFSVIVFSEDSDFKTEMPPQVMRGEDLVNFIQSKTRVLLEEGELLMAVGKLSMLCQSCSVSDEQHTENLEVMHHREWINSNSSQFQS